MRFEDYTKDQQKAIISKGTNIIVSAGAGSGKTQVLTERVVHFIRDENYKLNEFLILTFTNLAAGEMKDRIRRALTEEKLDAANDVDLADICTFDSYALSLVKKYHFMLNVSPNISIVDSNIIDVRKRRIIEELFDEEYVNKNDDFKSLIKTYCFKDDKELRDLLLKFYNKSLLEIDSKSYIDNFINNYYNDDFINIIKEKINKKINDDKEELKELINIMPDIEISSKDKRTVLEAYNEFFNKFFLSNEYEDNVNSLPEKMVTIRLPNGCSEHIKQTKEELKKLIDKLLSFLNSLPKSDEAFKNYFIQNIPFVNIFIRMSKKLDEDIINFKNQHQTFEFQDISKMALQLVKENEEVRNNIKNNLKMIMIDEYQDTSFLQEAFVSYISNNNVYMVGDVKQSIYRFRNARCDIFVDKYKKYSNNEGGIAIDLNKNFRSRKEVLDDINYIFKQIMTEKYGEADYAKNHVIEYGNKDYLKAGDKKDNNIDFLVYNDTNSSEIPEIEANLIARDIIEKINNNYQVLDYVKDNNGKKIPTLRNCNFSDFCILMDRGVSFDIYSKVFNEYKLPLYVENDEDISSNDLVVILTNILRLMKSIRDYDFSNKEFLKAFLSVARSFLFEYNDQKLYDICQNNSFKDDEIVCKINEILFKYSYLSISELFEKIIYELDIYHKCISIGNVAKNEKYLNTFLEMFKTMSKLDYSIDDFILFMECIDEYNLKITLSSTGSPFNSIRIMNIHKSKGLEFNIIYYSGLKKQFNRMDSKEEFGISSKYGFILPPDDLNMDNIVKRVNSIDEIEEDTSEKIRLFYVALTRTREKMICLLPSSFDDYSKCIKELNINNYNKYINNNSFLEIDKDEAFKIIYNDFLNNEINDVILEMVLEYIDFKLPYKFLNGKNRHEISYEQIKLWIQEEKEYDIKINNIVNELLKEYIYPTKASLSAFDMYVNNKIDFYEFEDIIFGLGMQIDSKFYEKLDELYDALEDPYNGEIDRNLVELKEEWINELDEYKLNPFKDIKCKYEKYVIEAIKLCSKKEIDIDTLNIYLNIMNIKIRQDVYDALNDEDQIPEYMLSNYSIINPIADYDLKEEFKEYINNIKNAYHNNMIYDIDVFNLLSFVYEFVPYKNEMLTIIDKLSNKEIDYDSFIECVKIIGFDFREDAKKMYYDIYNGLIDADNAKKYLESNFINNVTINGDYFFDFIEELDSFTYKTVLKKMFILFKNKEINLDKFKLLINCLNYELTKEFSILSLEEQLSFDYSDMGLIVVDKGNIRLDFDNCMSFLDLINPYNSYRKFKHYTIDLKTKMPKLNKKQEKIIYEDLNVEDLNIESEIIQTFRASKELNLNASKENMDFGTKAHFVMEITDFKNPNYDILDDMYKDIVKRFLESPLMKNVNRANIYKEYEFIDVEENINGIIDLMLIYDDHIDIIDYKTKNIDDESYDKQLKIYKDYISKISKLPIDIYLYALLNGDVKRINS